MVSRCPALAADVVTSRFSSAVTVGSRSGSDSCMLPVVLAQRIDDRFVQTDWLWLHWEEHVQEPEFSRDDAMLHGTALC